MSNTSSDFSSEPYLLAQLRAGNPRAVTYWFNHYQPLLNSYLTRKISSSLDREELVQEIFINCLQHLASFKGKSSLKTWMFSIANHEVADYYRKQYAKKVIRAVPLLDNLLHLEDGPIYDSHDAALKIRQALSRLSAEARELLMLKYIDKRSVKDIAQSAGRTPKAIESDLFRARNNFRRAYQDDDS